MLEWTNDRTDALTFAKLVLSIIPVSLGLSLATGSGFDPAQVGEYVLAAVLNILAIPISFFELGEFIGRPELFQFGFLEWNILVLLWLSIGWSISDVVLRLFGSLRSPLPEPSLRDITAVQIIPILAGVVVEYVYGGGVEMIGKVWVAVLYNIFLLPSFIFGDAYADFDMQMWLAVVGSVVVVISVVVLLNKFTSTKLTTPSLSLRN